MVQCFVPDCNHRSVVHSCRFHRFPKNKTASKQWRKLIRRADKVPNLYARVCSCHFTQGIKNGPTWFPGRVKRLPVWFPARVKRLPVWFPARVKRLPVWFPGRVKRLPGRVKRLPVWFPGRVKRLPVWFPARVKRLPGRVKRLPVEGSLAVDVEQHPYIGSPPVEQSMVEQHPPLEGSPPVEKSQDVEQHPYIGCPPVEESLAMEQHPSLEGSPPMEKSLDVEQHPYIGSPPVEKSLAMEGSQPVEERLPVEEGLHGDYDPKRERFTYSASTLKEKVLRMETGLPDRSMFNLFVGYTKRFEESIVYHFGWKVTCLSFEDQILMTLMKLRQNYTNLHLAQLFQCSSTTVRNVVLTFIYVLHKLWFTDIMTNVPSREKNLTSLPASFKMYPNCRMVIDCTDVEIASPGSMALKKHTYSSYRGMHSFKILLGVAPNAVITYCSKLYPGSVSDKAIVANSGILNVFKSGDLILADKGFLIRDIVPEGVSVNIPPFLNHGKMTKSEIKLTKDIARCRIHVERANARLKEFRILHNIPHTLRSHADAVVQLCCALVNLQNPLIKEVAVNLGE